VVVRQLEAIKVLRDAAGGQSVVLKALVTIAVCAYPTVYKKTEYRDRGLDWFCIQDAAATIQNMLLTGFALGLGTLWVGGFDEERVSAILDLPFQVQALGLVLVGHTNARERIRPKRPLEEVAYHEAYWNPMGLDEIVRDREGET
jgi:nitroreductase